MNSARQGQRNQLVEVCRFVAAMLIVCHHSNVLGARSHFVGGWVFVEFFFLLTGYFTALHVTRSMPCDDCSQEAFRYVKEKVVRLVPFAWTGIALGIVATLIAPDQTNSVLRIALSIPYNLLFLKGAPISAGSMSFNTPLWYLTMIILFLPPLIVAMRKVPQAYKYLLCWIVPVLLLSCNMVVIGKLSAWEMGYPRLIRGLADLMLGTALYYLAEWIHECASIRMMLAIRVAGIALFVGVSLIAVMLHDEGAQISSELVLLTCLATLLLLANGRNYLVSREVRSVCLHLGALSMPVFCLHYPILQIVQACEPALSYGTKLILSIAITIALSEALMQVFSKKRRGV